MANFQTTSSFGTSIDPFAGGQTHYVLPQGITVASDGTALFNTAVGAGTIDIFGDVFGGAGINFGNSVGSGLTILSRLNIGSSAHVSSSGSSAAVNVSGNHVIINAGEISSSGANGVGILTSGAGSIVNTGQILASSFLPISPGFVDAGIRSSASTATDIVALTNSGTISGTTTAYQGAGSMDRITNSGTMFGDVLTAGGDDKIINYGAIRGNIDLGAGNDKLYTKLSDQIGYSVLGGIGTDTLVNLDNTGVVNISLTTSGFEYYFGQGAVDSVWAGDATADAIFSGGAGNDAFIGGAGNDFVEGGSGADYLDGGTGFNILSYAGSLQSVVVSLIAGTASGGDATGDIYVNFHGVSGSAASDTIYGDNGVNYISGGGGGDIMVGYGGNDTLIGGAGNDIFYYNAPGYGQDEITDFTIGQDTIYLSTSIAASFASLSLVQSGANVLLTTGTDSVQIDNVLVANLHASDFVFF